jgi:P27 family predicted phage terminase small subunit
MRPFFTIFLQFLTYGYPLRRRQSASEREMSRSQTPKAPPKISKEQRAEFRRICSELSRIGKLDCADRALISLYLDVWAVYRKVLASVVADGPVIVHEHNKVKGISHEMKLLKELARQLRGLLRDLELTPAARSKATANQPIDEEQGLGEF